MIEAGYDRTLYLYTNNPHVWNIILKKRLLYIIRKQIFASNFFNQQGGTEFIPVKVGRAVLQSMNRHEVFIKRWPQPLIFNYYKSIMPDVAITLCQTCNRVSGA